ncbi:hypothetical protein EVJ58_g9800 [Rhodofomes roseus]|uniref:Uncharacterized protein n=1 Tax=Rhodofomes roseus TaxID=34475 RepID=A0A4Y9XW85_9APHY|nr:hypothetical protein EVJ58_g9800 [Rhodofomes roseus]
MSISPRQSNQEQVPPARNARQRHAFSNPEEPANPDPRERRQSRNCQKAAWPVHKHICKLNQETVTTLEARPAAYLERLEALRDFTRKHRATISEAAFFSVRHNYLPPSTSDPVAASKEREDVLVIELRTRPNAHRARPEKRFYVMGAQLETFSSFFPEEKLDEMHLRLRNCREEATAHRGPSGAVIVVFSLNDPDIELMNVMPVAFLLDQSDVEELGRPWKEFLIHMLNRGIVE